MTLRHELAAEEAESDDPGFLRSTIAVALVLALSSGQPASASTFQEKAPAPEPIEFTDDLDSALAAAKRSGRPIVVIFGAVW